MKAANSSDHAAGAVESAGMSLRCIFVATAYLAVLCAALSFPSIVWIVGFALANVVVAVYAAQRAAVSPDARPFWLGYLAGVGAFLAALTCIKVDFVNSAFVGPLWNRFHMGFTSFNAEGATKFNCFRDAFKLAMMIAVPFVVALATKTVLRKSATEPPAASER